MSAALERAAACALGVVGPVLEASPGKWKNNRLVSLFYLYTWQPRAFCVRLGLGLGKKKNRELRTADEGGSEGSGDDRSHGSAASRGDGGALQEHDVRRIRRIALACLLERGVVRGICEDGLIWEEVDWRIHPDGGIGQSRGR